MGLKSDPVEGEFAISSKEILDASMTPLEGQAPEQNSMQKYVVGTKQVLLYVDSRTISGSYFHVLQWTSGNICVNL